MDRRPCWLGSAPSPRAPPSAPEDPLNCAAKLVLTQPPGRYLLRALAHHLGTNVNLLLPATVATPARPRATALPECHRALECHGNRSDAESRVRPHDAWLAVLSPAAAASASRTRRGGAWSDIRMPFSTCPSRTTSRPSLSLSSTCRLVLSFDSAHAAASRASSPLLRRHG